MIIIEIPENPNCPETDMRVFHDLEPPRPVTQVRLERRPGEVEWCHVTGWTTHGTPCPAKIQKVDDSGDGTAFLLHGGDAGLRLQPAASDASWGVGHAQQWGEPFMILADLTDIRGERDG